MTSQVLLISGILRAKPILLLIPVILPRYSDFLLRVVALSAVAGRQVSLPLRLRAVFRTGIMLRLLDVAVRSDKEVVASVVLRFRWRACVHTVESVRRCYCGVVATFAQI